MNDIETKLTAHYLEERSHFFHHVQNCIIRQEEEDIHQLRVSIKRIRAIYDCIELSTKHHLSTAANKQILKKLFKTAGKIREVQINQALLDNYGGRSSQRLLNYFDRLKDELSAPFNYELSHFQSGELLRQDKKLIKAISGIGEKEVLNLTRTFLNTELQRVGDLFEKNFDQNLHRIRKSVKAMMEINRLLISISEDESLILFRKNLKSLSDDIGNWHDLQVFMQSLKTLNTIQIDHVKRQDIEDLIKKADDDSHLLKGKIHRGLGEDLPQNV